MAFWPPELEKSGIVEKWNSWGQQDSDQAE